jgi:DNA polymerase I-like protein with 3'-5' exonuclease and polymerase domains
VFDGLVLQHWSGAYFWDNWIACTYGLFRELATEGYVGQSWSLEEAEHKLLNWPESNKNALRDWLVANGHTVKSTGKADKALMFNAPHEIISTYCALDADACWQLYFKVFLPYLERFPFLKTYHERYFLNAVKLAVEQYMSGSYIDVEALTKYDKQLLADIDMYEKQFLTHPSIVKYIREFNDSVISEIKSNAPKQFKKNGDTTKGYIKWLAKVKKAEEANYFNLNSDYNLRWLFYEKMHMPITLTTDSGRPAVSNKILKNFGEVGRILLDYNDKVKMQGFTKAALEEVKDNIIHVRVRPGSTLTGRATGGEKSI